MLSPGQSKPGMRRSIPPSRRETVPLLSIRPNGLSSHSPSSFPKLHAAAIVLHRGIKVVLAPSKPSMPRFWPCGVRCRLPGGSCFLT
jgi:hypothetical protein